LSFDLLDHQVFLSSPERNVFSAWNQHIPFGMLLVDLVRPKQLVELGSLHGASFCAFCQAVKELSLDCRCFAVDTWAGDKHAGYYGPEILADLEEYHNGKYGSFSTLIQAQFDDACAKFADKSIDLLHIDGLHTYEAVKHDFDTWLPKMSERGIVVFHDVVERRLDFGVWRLWSELKARYTHHFEFHHAHGLGIVAVGETVPEGLRTLMELPTGEVLTLREMFHQLGERIEHQQRIDELSQRNNFLELSTEERASSAEAELERQQAEWQSERKELLLHFEQLAHAVTEQNAAQQVQLNAALWELSRLESSRGVRLIKLARASRAVLQDQGPFVLTKRVALWISGRRGQSLRTSTTKANT
jgi:O-antigen biosynthesis protein